MTGCFTIKDTLDQEMLKRQHEDLDETESFTRSYHL